MSDIKVHIKLNGVEETLTIPFEEDLPLHWVKDEARTTFGVVNGTLSSRENEIRAVRTVTAGSTY